LFDLLWRKHESNFVLKLVLEFGRIFGNLFFFFFILVFGWLVDLDVYSGLGLILDSVLENKVGLVLPPKQVEQ
jgi:hypothetical protein